jgi:hypothetical protein
MAFPSQSIQAARPRCSGPKPGSDLENLVRQGQDRLKQWLSLQILLVDRSRAHLAPLPDAILPLFSFLATLAGRLATTFARPSSAPLLLLAVQPSRTPLLVCDYRGRERHRFGRTVDTRKAGMLEATLPRPVDPDHLPNGRRSATCPDDAITLPNFDLSACTHDVPFRNCATAHQKWMSPQQ